VNVTDPIKLGFEPEVIVLPLDGILLLRTTTGLIKKSTKYKRILASITEVGIIEPLSVSAPQGDKGLHLLLDGYLRYAALLELGETTACCLIAVVDEAYTANKRINRLSTIQEHFMIVRALGRSVSAEKLARALDMDVKFVWRRRKLLDGICPEVIEQLKDKHVNPQTFEILRKMKPMRQIDAAELMAAAGNYTASYAKALLAATRQEDLIRADRPKKINGMSQEQMARMEREMESLQRDFKAIEASYGDDMLNLVIAGGYVSRLLANAEIRRYLEQRHPEILKEFTSIAAAASLDHADAAA
jgi:hypothetical protein